MNRRIQAKNHPGPKGSSTTAVIDADTGALLADLSAITIKIARDDVIVADVSYLGGETQTRYVEKIDVVISGEAVDKQ